MLQKVLDKLNKKHFAELHREMSFGEYIDLVYKKPKLLRTSHQMIYDMIMSKGSFVFERYRKRLTHYNFFDFGPNPIYGIEESLDKLVKYIKGAAGNYGTERRILLMHGPVGSSKSTIARCLKRGMESYSVTEEGAWYSFKWVNLPTGSDGGIYTSSECECQMHENPFKLIPIDVREDLLGDLNEILLEQTDNKLDQYKLKCDGDLDPKCRYFMTKLMEKYKGDWEKIVTDHIRVIRKVYSESDRVGIATFQPKDEKSQDSTELTGDIDWSKLQYFGDEACPAAFSFSGEMCKSNRGLIEFIEMLKLADEFLYDLLGATQEQQIKPKRFAQIHIDEMIISHSNLQEYEKLINNNSMVALRDRMVKIDVPYLLKWSDEIKVLEQDYGKNKIKQHIVPHTLEMVALWGILTRLKDDKDAKLDPVKKAKLYNGEQLPGFAEDAVKEMMQKNFDEGMDGVSVRYTQEKISNCLSDNPEYVNVFMVMNEIKEGLDNSSLITDKEAIGRYFTCVDYVMEEYNDILKNEVRRALLGDEKIIERICANYIDNLIAYVGRKKIKNKITGRDEPPNERLMRSIEEKIGVPVQGTDDFRRTISSFMGELSHQGKQFKWDSNPELKKALEIKLFEDIKDHIKLSALNTAEVTAVQPDIQEKIDAIKKRLVEQYGYNEKSAQDVLEYVGSIFSRGQGE